jgi:hypothetical protein
MTELHAANDGRRTQGDTGNAELCWTVNPWRANWRRPAAALAICIAVALLGGYSFNVPNFGSGVVSGTSTTDSDASANGVPTDADMSQAHDAVSKSWWPSMLAWSGLGFLLLFSFTAVIYLPVRYKLDNNGVTVTFLGAASFRPWKHYRNFYVHGTGVHLTTMPKPSGLDPFRGHFLQYSGNREAVVSYIKAHVKLRGVPEGQEPPRT